jgi:large conductance mechanosensitive channel
MSNGNGGFWADFRKFIAQGSVVELAVAVIIGGAFGKIIESLVTDIITPVILSPALKAANLQSLQDLSINGIKYGSFLAAVINFIVIALSIFVMIRSFEKMKRRSSRQATAEAAPPDPAALQQQTAESLNRLARALETRGL